MVDCFKYAESLKWRQVAWNGVRFDTPMDWEIGKIGHRYLLLEAPRGPAMEIKWAPVKGKFKLRTQLKRLAASQGRQLRRGLREEKLPMDWARAIERYDSLGFAWQTDSIGGRGVVLYCPGCRKAVLLQFFEKTGQRPFGQADRVLASFDDHPEGRKTLWSVFDIVAEVPVAYHLKRFRFEAGAYELSFTNRQSQLTLAALGSGGRAPQGRRFGGFRAEMPRTVHKPIRDVQKAITADRRIGRRAPERFISSLVPATSAAPPLSLPAIVARSG